MRLRVQVSAERGDLNLFAGVRKLHSGREVVFEGSYGFGEDIVARGWLRASHRSVRTSRANEWEAWHPHDVAVPVRRGEAVELDVTLLPSATRFAAGDELVLELRDRWFFPANPITGQFPAVYERPRRQRWRVHTGGSTPATLTIPVWSEGAPG
jgi:predicted acyl esterase